MKFLLFGVLFALSFATQAQRPCYSEMSHIAYRDYAKSEKISFREAKSLVDLFVDSFKSSSHGYTFKVELAEQYSTDSESGYYPGRKLEISLNKLCQLIKLKKQ